VSQVLRSEERVAEKPHRCWYCDQLIAKGERHGYRTGVDGGDFWSMRMHLECDAWAVANWDHDMWENHDPKEFQRPTSHHAETANPV
jgi:hypothetical protein